MAGGQRHRIVEEEERRPPSRGPQGRFPTLVFEEACDPERSGMVAGELTIVVDETTPVPREQTTRWVSVQIAVRVDSIGQGHRCDSGSPGNGSADWSELFVFG